MCALLDSRYYYSTDNRLKAVRSNRLEHWRCTASGIRRSVSANHLTINMPLRVMKNNYAAARKAAGIDASSATSPQFCEACYAAGKVWAMISVSKGDRNPQPDTPTSRPTATITTCLSGRAVNFSFSKKPPAVLLLCTVLTARTEILDSYYGLSTI